MQSLCDAFGPCTLAVAERVWAAARAAIVSPAPDEPADAVARVLLALARWRRAAARAPPELRTAAFVATCTARMAALDAVGSRHEAVRALLGSEPDEADACASFELPESQAAALEAVRLAARQWNATVFSGWPAVAYAVCFAMDEQVAVDEAFLATCAAFDADCALRSELRAMLRQPPAADDPRREAVLAWAARVTRNANDDLFALGREACVWTYLTPEAHRKGSGAPSARLASWDPDQAARAHETSSRGFAALREGGAPQAMVDAMMIFLLDYVLRQTVDVRFMDMFFIQDYASGAALERLDAFRRERLRAPPPLVAHSMGEWYTVRRASDGALVTRRSACAADAVLCWLDHVMTERQGLLFLGKRIDTVFAEMTAHPEVHAERLIVRTEEI